MNNEPGHIYEAFSRTLGPQSPLAERHLARLQDIVQKGLSHERMGFDDHYLAQDELYTKLSLGEIASLDELMVQQKAISNQLTNTRLFDDATRTIDEYDVTAHIEGSVNDGDIDKINELMQIVHSLDSGTLLESAPFKSYLGNNDTAWQYVDSETTQRYLKMKPFISDRDLGHVSHNARSITSIYNHSHFSSESFEIPTRVMVSATGFESWLGRNDTAGREGMGEKSIALRGFSYDVKSVSLDAIKAYASQKTELPPVADVHLYVQPDGLAFAGNGSGDSHRIGAAILRGEKTIKATGLTTYLLKDNHY